MLASRERLLDLLDSCAVAVAVVLKFAVPAAAFGLSVVVPDLKRQYGLNVWETLGACAAVAWLYVFVLRRIHRGRRGRDTLGFVVRWIVFSLMLMFSGTLVVVSFAHAIAEFHLWTLPGGPLTADGWMVLLRAHAALMALACFFLLIMVSGIKTVDRLTRAWW